MNSTTIPYEIIEHNLTNSAVQNTYFSSSTRFILKTIIRCCQILIGISANIMTLIIIKRLRLRLNMHIIMVYLALADILVLATLLVGIYPKTMEINLISYKSYWETYCIVIMFFNMIGYTGSLLTYLLLSIDMYVLSIV